MSLLSQAKATRRAAPHRFVIHGPGGVGKSTLGACAPSPIFIAAEDGLSNIDAHSLPEPEAWSDVLAQLDALALEAHTYRSVVVDSLDWLEPLVWSHVVKKANKASIKSIEDFGYGKGYIAALDEWRIFLKRLGALRAKGMNVVLIAHSVRKTVKNPSGDDYESWIIKLNEKATGLIEEWVDLIGFATHDISTFETSKDSGRFKGVTTGKRVLKAIPHPAYQAKTRFAIPKSLPLDWVSLDKAVRAGSVSALERLKAEFESKLEELADAELEKNARAFVDERGVSVSSLSDAISTLDSYLVERMSKAS